MYDLPLSLVHFFTFRCATIRTYHSNQLQIIRPVSKRARASPLSNRTYYTSRSHRALIGHYKLQACSRMGTKFVLLAWPWLTVGAGVAIFLVRQLLLGCFAVPTTAWPKSQPPRKASPKCKKTERRLVVVARAIVRTGHGEGSVPSSGHGCGLFNTTKLRRGESW